jgi:aminoglycoside phosphotransferase (APT) family kinase protein
MEAPGDLIASGRDADIFEYGQGQVLRRSRNGRSMTDEARIMEFVRTQGYPVPEVVEVSDDGCDLVMERIGGPTMVDMCEARPWRIGQLGSELAELHQRLHDIPAPEWLNDAPCGVGDRLLHMDLHPLNVLVAPKGPVVIDWTNAARGEPSIDVALAWALIASGEVSANRLEAILLGIGRKVLLRAFLKPFRNANLRSVLRDVVDWKCQDPHMSEIEKVHMRFLVDAGPT